MIIHSIYTSQFHSKTIPIHCTHAMIIAAFSTPSFCHAPPTCSPAAAVDQGRALPAALARALGSLHLHCPSRVCSHTGVKYVCVPVHKYNQVYICMYIYIWSGPFQSTPLQSNIAHSILQSNIRSNPISSHPPRPLNTFR